MTTVILDTRSEEAKRLLDFLKSTSYAKVIDEKTPNTKTLKAMEDVEAGRVNSFTSANELMTTLKKSAGV
jgi:hypothetical protein